MSILAHGALGYWDEVIFIGIVIIFIGFMGVSWIKSRNETPEFDQPPPPPPESQPTGERQTENDRFELD